MMQSKYEQYAQNERNVTDLSHPKAKKMKY